MRRHFAGIALLLSTSMIGCQPQTEGTDGVNIPIDDDDIAGVVRSLSGVEAGVWVIAETESLGTRFARIVVTDDEGRYVVPDLPAADYQLWVRGYGLVDSAKVPAAPGDRIDLIATAADGPATASSVYPAAYWYSMLHLPSEEEVADIPGGMNNYLMWIKNMGCVGCHQMGQAATRTLPAMLQNIESSEQAWARRISSGQAGGNMIRLAADTLKGVPIKYLADWSERIAAGETPATRRNQPSRSRRAMPRASLRSVLTGIALNASRT
jgi:hypothetical protein